MSIIKKRAAFDDLDTILGLTTQLEVIVRGFSSYAVARATESGRKCWKA
jgi:hypothetical protein